MLATRCTGTALLCATLILVSAVPFVGREQNLRGNERWLRVWSSGEFDIAARADGWVAIQRGTDRRDLMGAHDYRLPYDIFSPDEVARWTGAVRAFIARPQPDTTTYERFVSASGTSLGVSHSRASAGDLEWRTFLTLSCGERDYGSARSLALLNDYTAKLDSAAALARSQRSIPDSIDRRTPRDASDLACGATARAGFAEMPIDSLRIRAARALAPVEVLAQFNVTAARIPDSSSFEFYPALSLAQSRTLIAAVRRWSWSSAVLAGPVTTRSHTVVRFVIPGDATDIATFDRGQRGFRWVARSDGLVEWSDGSVERSHEVYTPGEILQWISEIRAIHAAAPSTAGQAVPQLNAEAWPQLSPASPWYAELGRRQGARLLVQLIGSGNSAPVLSARRSGCGGSAYSSLLPVMDVNDWLMRAEDAAKKALEISAGARVDSSRVYGELEITCAARRRNGASDASIQDDSIRTALALSDEALVAFIIDTDGNVDPRTAHVFGPWSESDRNRILSAVARLEYTAPRLSGIRVAQRSHYTISPPLRSAPGSYDRVNTVCVGAQEQGIRVTVLSPATGARHSDLERIAFAISNGRGNQMPARFRSGVFQAVILPDGSYSFLQWIVPPAEPARIVVLLPSQLPVRLGETHPIGVEVAAGVRCQ